MRVHIATDHAGLEFSRALRERLEGPGHEVIDHGPREYDPLDDYPSFCVNAAIGVANDWRKGESSLGVVFGGSGNGEQMAANKVPGIRAALVWNRDTAVLAREHNNANVCAIGARQHEQDEALELIDIFLATPFPGDERHVRRIGQLDEFQQTGRIHERDVLDQEAGPVPVVLDAPAGGSDEAVTRA